jgi:hypothetical protein
MSARPKDQPEPSYWSNAFSLWYTGYTDSKFRVGLIDNHNFQGGEVDSHDVHHETAWPSTMRESRRLYASPYGQKFPRECAKEINKYAECKKSYGVYANTIDVPQCDWAKEYVLEGCPHWVLENMAFSKRFHRRAEKIDMLTYQRAMEVSDYNK